MITYTHEEAAEHLSALTPPSRTKIFQVRYKHLETSQESKLSGNKLPSQESLLPGTYEARVFLIAQTTKDGEVHTSETEVESFRFRVEQDEPEDYDIEPEQTEEQAPALSGMDAQTQFLIASIQAQAQKEAQAAREFFAQMAQISENAQREIREERRAMQDLIAQERREAMRLVSSVARHAVGGDADADEDEGEGGDWMQQLQSLAQALPQFQAALAALQNGAGPKPMPDIPDIPTEAGGPA